MRFLLNGVLAGFLLANTSVVFATNMEKGCVCLRGYHGFSVLLELDEVKFACITSGDTEEVAGRKAIFHPFFLMLHSKFPKLLMLPFSVSIMDTQIADIIVDRETGVAYNSKTGAVSKRVSVEENGYSAWFRLCECGRDKLEPKKLVPRYMNKERLIEIKFRQ